MAASRAALAALTVVALLAGTTAAAGQTLGRSTVEQRLLPSQSGPFSPLAPVPGETWRVREEGLGTARAGRSGRRRSLLYFAQLTDFQLADEESPARVEFLDRAGGPFVAAWRPQEALGPHTIDSGIRQVNAFADRSPVTQAAGARSRMALALITGDNADNHQLNETRWVLRLLEGGRLEPNSGREPQPAYTGVGDRRDMPAPDSAYYDPNAPSGPWSAWPRYPDLLDRAQHPFSTPGLRVPSYVAFGNHDIQAQGTQWTNAAFETVALGGLKAFGGGLVGPVPSDPDRRFVDKAQYKQEFRTAASADAHGFGLVDPAEERASNGAAGYYSWAPAPGVRFISVDTMCEAGSVYRPGPSEGNVDDPQFRWLRSELAAATRRDELVVLFSHHAIPSLTCAAEDEEVGSCSSRDSHGHGVNPGCDLDPRPSGPVHLGEEVRDLVLGHPHVIAWVAGHTHNNVVEPFRRPDGRGFWSLRLSSEIDWPQQNRLIEIMDNADGTLSIFGTILDTAAPAELPLSGTAADGLSTEQLASISRALAANDPQIGYAAAHAEGGPEDRNVELIVRDPRRNPPPLSRLRPRRLSALAFPRSDPRRPYRFRISGGLRPPAGMSNEDACNGRVRVALSHGGRRFLARTARLDSRCRYAVTLRTRRRGRLVLVARFIGNRLVGPRRSPRRTLLAGRP